MDICFVSLPFTPIERPMISFGLLQSLLKKENIRAITLYYNLDFAEKIGAKNYHVMSQFAYVLFGEWVFSQFMFPDTVNSDEYLRNMHDLLVHSKIRPLPQFNDKDYLFNLRSMASAFIKETAAEVIKKHNPRIVACSSIFDNHIACVSFLKCIKEQSPETVTMIGGQNCQGEMGKTTHNLFPFVDYVVSGYADHLITGLCKSIFTYGMDMPAGEVPNQVLAPIFRDKKYRYADDHLEPKSQISLNELPIPDYDDYFNKLDSLSNLRRNILPGIPIESSRGCWWSKCKFCGLKQRLSYQKKDWEQVYNEIVTLGTVYKTRKFMFCDNNVPFNKLHGMLDKLTEDSFDLHMWAEIRVEMKKEQLKKMKEAGVTFIQVGIESLNDNFLNCMNKGSTMLQNIQIIKWAQQYGMFIIYTIMHGFPNEKDEWFRELGHILPLIMHLQPPRGMSKLRFDRFSDYYLNPSHYGLDLSALEIYSHIYPYDQKTINNFAYFFEDKKDHRMRNRTIFQNLFGKSKGNFSKINDIVIEWMRSYYSGNPCRLTYKINDKNISVHDTRLLSSCNDYVLNEPEGEIFLLCDEIHTLEEINNKLGGKYNAADIDNTVRSLINKNIVLKHEQKLLTLAVEAPLPDLPEGNDFPCGTVLSDM